MLRRSFSLFSLNIRSHQSHHTVPAPMSKGKGKQTRKGKQTEGAVALLPLMPNPSVGSANPSTSLSALWGYILPMLNHIIHSPTNSTNKAPAIEPPYHIGIHTATYNYFTMQSKAANSRADKGPSTVRSATRADLYEQLDKYFMDLAWELLLGTPKDDMALVQYIIPCFKRYSMGTHSINQLLNYIKDTMLSASPTKIRVGSC